MPLRVLHLLGTAQPEGAAIARLVRELALNLDPQRYTLEAWFLGEDGPLADELRGVQIATLVRPFPGRNVRALAKVWRELRRASAHIVHLHLRSRSLRWAAATSGKKLLLHLHARRPESGQDSAGVIPTRGADAVLAVSNAVAQRAGGGRPVVIYPGVRSQGPPLADRKLHLIGTAGRLAPIKGLPYLLQAVALIARNIPDVALEIAGSGPEHAALQREAERLGISERVRFLGWVPELHEVMRRWRVFAQASREEACPVAVLEAMATGLPIVATEVGGLPELVESGRTGWLVPAADAEALAGRIMELLRDPDRASEMGRAGQERVREHFSAERMARSVAALYDQLAASDL